MGGALEWDAMESGVGETLSQLDHSLACDNRISTECRAETGPVHSRHNTFAKLRT